jgi:hypothetical protein
VEKRLYLSLGNLKRQNPGEYCREGSRPSSL